MERPEDLKKWDLKHILPNRENFDHNDLLKKELFLKQDFYDTIVKKVLQEGMENGSLTKHDQLEFRKTQKSMSITFAVNNENNPIHKTINHKLTFQKQNYEQDLMILENYSSGVTAERTINKMNYYECNFDLFENHLIGLFREIRKIIERR